MEKPKMNVEELMSDMRKRGCSISHKTLNEGVDCGLFPFVHVLGHSSGTGRRRQVIMRKEYMAWADKNIGGYIL